MADWAHLFKGTVLGNPEDLVKKARGIPRGARSLDELLSDHDQWKKEARSFFVTTRTATGMSQNAFAKAIGTSQSYVNEIESGKKTPSSGTLAKLRSLEGGTDGNQDQE